MADVIYTNHLKERLYDRKISDDQVFQTVRNPDSETKKSDTCEYKKKFGNQTVTAVIKHTNDGKILVLSVWINPPNPGTLDIRNSSKRHQMKKASPLRKIWLTFLNQLGV